MRWSSPAPPGHGRIGAGPELRLAQDYDREVEPLFNGFLEYRRGVSPTWDVGGRLSGVSATLDTRHLLTKSDLVETSAGAGLRFGIPTDRLAIENYKSYELGIEPDARIGLNVSRRSQLAFALRPVIAYTRTKVREDEKRGLSFRPELIVAFDIGISDGFHIVPQLGVQTLVGVDSFYIVDDTVLIKGALGVYF